MIPYYKDDLVTLYHGDCLEVAEWLDADVLVTDPPYGIDWQRPALKADRSKNRGVQTENLGILNDSTTSFRDSAISLWGDRPSMTFGAWSAQFPSGAGEVLVWRKPATTGMFGARRGFRKDTELVFVRGKWPERSVHRSSLFVTDGSNTDYFYEHPHSKPIKLLTELIECCPPGVIADPFAGSGSTLLAARNLGRQSIGVELEERYCELIAKRLSQQAFDFGSIEEIRAAGWASPELAI